jgi:hypothetical protein
MVAMVTGTPMMGFPAVSVYVTDILQVFWFVEDVTTQEPEIANLLCSERTPAPIVVDADAVVEAVDTSIMLVDVPRSAGPTMEPCPGRAWVMLGEMAANEAVDDAELGAVSAAAMPPDKAKNTIERAVIVVRDDFINIYKLAESIVDMRKITS